MVATLKTQQSGLTGCQPLELAARAGEAFQMELSILEFFDAPTVAEQAALVETSINF